MAIGGLTSNRNCLCCRFIDYDNKLSQPSRPQAWIPWIDFQRRAATRLPDPDSYTSFDRGLLQYHLVRRHRDLRFVIIRLSGPTYGCRTLYCRFRRPVQRLHGITKQKATNAKYLWFSLRYHLARINSGSPFHQAALATQPPFSLPRLDWMMEQGEPNKQSLYARWPLFGLNELNGS